MNRRKFTAALLSTAGVPLWCRGAFAQAESFPSQPIKIIVMYPPGGGADSLNRVVGERVSKNLGQPVIVDNRPGGAGVIAARAVLSAAADGYTILHAGTPIMTLAPKLVADAGYVPNDFMPVAGLAQTHYLLVARVDFPAHNLKEVVALAKQKPSELSCGNWGPLSITRIATALLTQRTGAKFSDIPYRGEAPLTSDLLGGQVQLGWITLPAAVEQIKAGKLKAFGVASASRPPLTPDVPTFIEQGISDFIVPGWSGLFVKKGTSSAIESKLHSEISKAVAAPEVNERLRNLGLDTLSLTTSAFQQMIERENERLSSILDIVASEVKK